MKAMILAAGVGSRLGTLTTKTPKCLIEIEGIPMLRLVAQSLARAGVTEVIINLHHHAEQVRAFASTSLRDLFKNIEFSPEHELLGTGGGLKAAAPFFLDQQAFLLVNADIYSTIALEKLIVPLRESKRALGCLAVMDRAESSYLEFDSHGNFCGWHKANSEKPLDAGNYLRAFCGLQALSSKIFDYLNLEPQKSFSIIDTYMKAYQSGETIHNLDIGNEAWFDMGTPQQLERLREHFKRNAP